MNRTVLKAILKFCTTKKLFKNELLEKIKKIHCLHRFTFKTKNFMKNTKKTHTKQIKNKKNRNKKALFFTSLLQTVTSAM